MLRLFTQPGKNLYAIVELRGKPYYIAPNDILITASLKSLAPGDTLSLDRVREIGSSTHILKGNPYIKPEFFKIEATVMDHSKSAEIGLCNCESNRGRKDEEDEEGKESNCQEYDCSY
jgi:ribosomal protein L21